MSRILLRHFYSPIDISRDDFSPRFVKLRHIDCRFLWKKNFCLNVAEEVERNERYVKRSGLRNFVADLIRNTSSFEPIKKKRRVVTSEVAKFTAFYVKRRGVSRTRQVFTIRCTNTYGDVQWLEYSNTCRWKFQQMFPVRIRVPLCLLILK